MKGHGVGEAGSYLVSVATCAELALALLAVGMFGVAIAPGPALAK